MVAALSTADSGMSIDRRSLLALGASGGVLTLNPASAGAATPAAAHLLTPQTTEGPYYIADPPRRADLAQGLSGTPLDIAFLVLDEAGAPVAGALVDVWHCDAQGRYSGFGTMPGEQAEPTLKAARFLRGAATADDQGRVVFHSVYPGWYEGRTTHIHFKVWRGDTAVLTCQFFLPDALSEFLYANVSAYRRAQLRDTLNRNDGIAITAGDRAVGSVREADGRYLASLTVIVDPKAHPVIDRPLGPPPGGPPSGGPPGAPPPGGPEGPGGPPPFPGGPPPRPDALTGEARVAALLPGPPLASPGMGPPPQEPKR